MIKNLLLILANVTLWATILSTLSCASVAPKSDRDPASISEACSASPAAAPDLAQLSSQTLFQLQQKELAQPSLDLYEQEFQHVVLMMTKSRLYFSGLTDVPDPRAVIVQNALAHGGGLVWKERLYTIDPSLRPSPSDEQVQAKAAAFINKNRTSEAREMLATFSLRASAPPELRLSARLDLMKSFRYQGSDDKFLEQLEANRAWFKTTFWSETSPSAKAVLAYSSYQQALIRSHIKKEKFDLAVSETNELKIFLRNERQSPAPADWLLGRIGELRGNPEAARASYAATLKGLPTDDITKEQVLWELGWTNYKLHHFAEAVEFWSQLPQTGAAQVIARTQFWIGQAEASQGHVEKAQEISRAILEAYPGTFYAPLAARDLGQPIRALEFEKSDCVIAGRVIARLKRKYAAEDVAAFASLYKQRDLPRAKQVLMDLSLAQGLDSSLYLASAVMGDYQPLILGFQRLPLGEQRELFQQFPQLIFPNPYPSLIDKASRANGLDPAFPLSVIRQESVFAPFSLSYADARGLMQVMPQEGEKYASELRISSYSTPRLYEPSINIAFGTRHLKQGFITNHESMILTLAAYNAGDEIAGVWDRHLSKNPLEFIEEIPFQETNGYVKAILRNDIYNRALYGHGSFVFPDELLKR